jgi:hypothetical protein
VTPPELIKRGAVLSATAPGGTRMLLGPQALVERGRLLFYDLVAERARALKFDAYEGGENDTIWLVQAGDRVARLSPVATESAEVETAWQQHWARQPAEHRSRLLERMRAALEAIRE